MRRIFLLVVPAILGCGGGGESAPTRKTIIDSRDTYDPRSLDPALSTDVPTGRVVAYVFDGLTRFTPDAKVVPGLAKSWEVSPDGITYTFHLRSGVKFHDGRPFTAKNVVASFQRVLDPATKGGRGWPLYPIKGAEDYAAGKAKTMAGMAAPKQHFRLRPRAVDQHQGRGVARLAVGKRLVALRFGHAVDQGLAELGRVAGHRDFRFLPRGR